MDDNFLFIFILLLLLYKTQRPKYSVQRVKIRLCIMQKYIEKKNNLFSPHRINIITIKFTQEQQEVNGVFA